MEVSEALSVGPGDVIAEKYRLDALLAEGGMGVVFAATHLVLRERVALKFLKPALSGRPETAARLLREARSAVRVRNEHVARVLDVGTLPSGLPFLVIEYLEGQDLAARLRAGGPLPVVTACEYVLQACEAIAEAHALGIIHRDLKPSNLFLTRRADGSHLVKVLDFGIALPTRPSAIVTSDAPLVHDGAGSPAYMAPEQVRGATADPRADIWAFGVVLFELLTGKLPFRADSAAGVGAAIVSDPPAPLRALLPSAPEGLEALVLRCLEKDPARRPATVAELSWSLLPFAPERARGHAERASSVLGAPQDISLAQAPPQAPAPSGSETIDPSSTTTSAPRPAQRPEGWGIASSWKYMLAAGLPPLVLAAAVAARSGPAQRPPEAASPSTPGALSPSSPAEPFPEAVPSPPALAPAPSLPPASSPAALQPSASTSSSSPPPSRPALAKGAAPAGAGPRPLPDYGPRR